MADGKKSSEFKLTTLVVLAGLALDVVAVCLETLTGVGVVAPWFPSVIAAIGGLMALLKAMGYTRSRTLLKLQEQAPALAAEVRADIPPTKELLETLQELKAEVAALKATQPTLPSTPSHMG